MQQDAWVTESRKTLLDRSPWLVVEDHEVSSPSGEPLERDEAGDEVILMDQDDARAALLRGEFRVFSWVNAVSMALLWLDSERQ